MLPSLSVLMHSLCSSATLPKSESNLLAGEMDPCWLPDRAFSGCSSVSQLLHGDSSRIIESFRLAKTLKTTKSWQVLFLTCSKACIHKLCCILDLYRGCINAQLHHPHQGNRLGLYGAARRMTSICDAQWQSATAAPKMCPACHH